MINHKKISRRLFLSFGIFPVVVHASPLVDLQRGIGLFSDPKSGTNNRMSNSFNLFNDPEPELNGFSQLKTNRSDKIVVTGTLNLQLINSNTKEEIAFRFPDQHKLSVKQISSLDSFLRDWRTSEIKSIDTEVLADFFKICAICSDERNILQVNVHSGFRSKKTNEYLRQNSHKVAKNSMHILGKAIDFSMPKFSSNKLAKIVRANTEGGVGGYQNFVHLDSGPKRSW
tara:strand:- start:1499 stop:2182 length:684 start_codon:yes stop_codon:yes gene_type:complete